MYKFTHIITHTSNIITKIKIKKKMHTISIRERDLWFVLLFSFGMDWSMLLFDFGQGWYVIRVCKIWDKECKIFLKEN